MSRVNGEGNIRQRKDGRWEVRISIGIDFSTGKTKRISRYAATKDEAVELLHSLQIQYNQGYDIAQNITVEEWLKTWLSVYMYNTLKQSTLISYEGYIKNHFIPSLGNIPLRLLTPRILQQFYNFKMNEGQLSAKTIQNLNLCIHKSLEQALKEGLILSNPASAINLPKQNKPQIEILTLEEQAKLIQASYRHRYGIFIRLVLVPGLRLGELLGLRWEDVDLIGGMLYVRRTLNRLQKPGLKEDYIGPRTEIVFQEPKTQNSIRSIPLLPELVQELYMWREIQKTDKSIVGDLYIESGMVVTNNMGNYIEPRTFKDYYEQMLRMANIRHFTFHALRHTFASRALEKGMDSKTLSVLMGHYSVSFTLDTYAHVLDGHKREGIQLLEGLYNLSDKTCENTDLL